jgi:hypothetical protein
MCDPTQEPGRCNVIAALFLMPRCDRESKTLYYARRSKNARLAPLCFTAARLVHIRLDLPTGALLARCWIRAFLDTQFKNN